MIAVEAPRWRAAGVTQRVAADILPDGKTLILDRGERVTAFATCSYLGLERDPRVTAAAIAALER